MKGKNAAHRYRESPASARDRYWTVAEECVQWLALVFRSYGGGPVKAAYQNFACTWDEARAAWRKAMGQ